MFAKIWLLWLLLFCSPSRIINVATVTSTTEGTTSAETTSTTTTEITTTLWQTTLTWWTDSTTTFQTGWVVWAWIYMLAISFHCFCSIKDLFCFTQDGYIKKFKNNVNYLPDDCIHEGPWLKLFVRFSCAISLVAYTTYVYVEKVRTIKNTLDRKNIRRTRKRDIFIANKSFGDWPNRNCFRLWKSTNYPKWMDRSCEFF